MSANFRLKELRTSAGLSQANVGDKLGVAQQTVGKWESGRTTPDPTTIVKLASLFGVTTDYLLGCTDIPNIYVDTKKSPLPKDQERAAKSIQIRTTISFYRWLLWNCIPTGFGCSKKGLTLLVRLFYFIRNQL